MEDHCRHRYLASVEGWAACEASKNPPSQGHLLTLSLFLRVIDSGRLKYLLLCRSVVVSHRMEWTQSFHGALDGKEGSPEQNLVILPEKNWDALPKTMDALISDQARAQFIADNAVRTLRGRCALSLFCRRSSLPSSQHFASQISHTGGNSLLLATSARRVRFAAEVHSRSREGRRLREFLIDGRRHVTPLSLTCRRA